MRSTLNISMDVQQTKTTLNLHIPSRNILSNVTGEGKEGDVVGKIKETNPLLQ